MSDSSVPRLIEQQVASAPTATALVSPAGAISYSDLNVRANAVARCLMANGLRRGGTVAVNMEPSIDTVIVLLAVLRRVISVLDL